MSRDRLHPQRFLSCVDFFRMGFYIEDEADFTRLLSRSLEVLHNATRNFYKFNDFNTDYQWRKDAFQLALASQVSFFDEMGGTTYESINSEPQSQSIGRTSITNVSRFNPGGANQTRSLLSKDAIMHLEQTGLLWRGGLR